MQSDMLSPKWRILLMGLRQGLLVILGAIEDCLGIARTKEPKHRQRQG